MEDVRTRNPNFLTLAEAAGISDPFRIYDKSDSDGAIPTFKL